MLPTKAGASAALSQRACISSRTRPLDLLRRLLLQPVGRDQRRHQVALQLEQNFSRHDGLSATFFCLQAISKAPHLGNGAKVIARCRFPARNKN